MARRPKLAYRKVDDHQDNIDTDGYDEREADDAVPVSAELAAIRKELKRTPDESPDLLLDTGSVYLNKVMGTPDGIPFGRVLEIAGEESHGKTALALELAAMAQKQHAAHVVFYDAEGSFAAKWARARGVDTDNMHLVRTYNVTEEKKSRGDKLVRVRRQLNSAEIFTELKMLIERLHQTDPERPIVLVVDSIASLVTPGEHGKNIEDYTMRETPALAVFMSQLLRKWNPICRNNNVLMVCINQLRTKPGVAFGDPRYTPGGKALPFHASVRVRMARVKGGTVTSGGKPVGAKGVITNIKNKTSKERETCGFKIFFDMDGKKPSEYMDASKIKRDKKD